MNPAWENRNSAGAQGQNATSGAGGAKELHQLPELPELNSTLRLIASAPIPEGLEERVHATLRTAPRGARVLAWPTALRPQAAWLGSGWARTAAAAAIVFVVAGGGWGVYLRLPHTASKVVAMPAPRKAGGFSSAGAIHTPDSIQGPLIANPVAANPVIAKHSKTHPGKLKTRNAETTSPVTPDPALNAVPTVAPAAAPAQH
jgi:hypothetical protein